MVRSTYLQFPRQALIHRDKSQTQTRQPAHNTTYSSAPQIDIESTARRQAIQGQFAMVLDQELQSDRVPDVNVKPDMAGANPHNQPSSVQTAELTEMTIKQITTRLNGAFPMDDAIIKCQ